ncbi:MAG TPA: O-succinylhomoserine sulfhydrylase [Nitriliruptoraceae bacterium]|nr:O-succinylhomoserine sulfhydrylase [Nitriliruptoraceae bacterium]
MNQPAPEHSAFDASDPATWGLGTAAVRGGMARSRFDETSEALYLSSGFVYANAAEAEASFAGANDHYIYSRARNPTLTMLEDRLALLEGAQACRVTASGMAAVHTSLASILAAGDRVVASRGLFARCHQVLDVVLRRFGVDTVFVDGSDLDAWASALAQPTAAVFFETPSNPMMELVDIAAVADLAHAAGALVIVDNVFATPVFQRPLELGADMVVYSLTKHVDGQGRVLGGAILGSADLVDDKVQSLMGQIGPTMSAFNAWVLLKGVETLQVRVRHQAASALAIATWLQDRPGVTRVLYPMLDSHPQRQLARSQMTGGGSVVTFEVEGGRDRAFEVVDGLSLIDISNNLGDAKSLATHPATSTHQRIGAEARASMGITDGTIRVSVGLEDVADLQADLANALSTG